MPNRTLSAALALLLLLGHGPAAVAEGIPKAKQADIERLLEITGSLKIAEQMSAAVTAQMAQTLKKQRPDLDPAIFDAVHEEVDAVIHENLPAFTSLVIPLYHHNFTHDDIKGLIRFYESDLGKKTIKVLPVLLQQSIAAGQQWGEALVPEIQQRVLKRLKTEGVDLSA